MLTHMLGSGRLKKDLNGYELPTPHKKSVRTALNRATRTLDELHAARRVGEAVDAPTHTRQTQTYKMDRDVRLDDAEEAASRAAAREQAMDALFAKASVRSAS
jgi:hypothetical protein